MLREKIPDLGRFFGCQSTGFLLDYEYMIIGNPSVVNFLRTALLPQAHAYTFALVGPDGVGKRTMARLYARELLTCSEKQLDTHPDFYYIERLEDDKTGKLKKDITVEQARHLKSRLGAKPWVAPHQVVVIDEAELINVEAGNALLKSLEEPPAHTIIFLLCENDQALLPTIRSRAQLLFMNIVAPEVLQAALIEQGAPPDQAQAITMAAWGRPGRALYFLDHPEALAEYDRQRADWTRLREQSFFERATEALKLIPDSDEGVRGREELEQVLAAWEVFFREALLQTVGGVPVHKKTTVSTAVTSPINTVHLIDQLSEARRLLRANVNPGLIIDNLLLAF